MCEMSFRSSAAYERQPDYVAGQMIQWSDKALQSLETPPVNIFFKEWSDYITRLGGEIISNDACNQAVQAFIWLRYVDKLNNYQVLTNAGYIFLAGELLNHVDWSPGPTYLVKSTDQGQTATRLSPWGS